MKWTPFKHLGGFNDQWVIKTHFQPIDVIPRAILVRGECWWHCCYHRLHVGPDFKNCAESKNPAITFLSSMSSSAQLYSTLRKKPRPSCESGINLCVGYLQQISNTDSCFDIRGRKLKCLCLRQFVEKPAWTTHIAEFMVNKAYEGQKT